MGNLGIGSPFLLGITMLKTIGIIILLAIASTAILVKLFEWFNEWFIDGE